MAPLKEKAEINDTPVVLYDVCSGPKLTNSLEARSNTTVKRGAFTMVGREIKGFLKALEESEVPGVISATETRERANAGTGGAGVLAIRPPAPVNTCFPSQAASQDDRMGTSVPTIAFCRTTCLGDLQTPCLRPQVCVLDDPGWGDRSLLCWSARLHRSTRNARCRRLISKGFVVTHALQ